MRPERAAALVRRWARLYTVGLPPEVAGRRVEEIDVDLHEQVAHERACGTTDRRIAADLRSRLVRGMVADLSWRTHEVRIARTRTNQEHTMTSALTRPAVRVSTFVLAVLAIPLVGMAVSDDVAWGVFDFVLAGALLTVAGVCAEVALRRRGTVVAGGIVAALGIASVVVGQVDDAPGLVLMGALLVAGGGAVAYQQVAARR